MNTETSLEIIPVWKNVTSAISGELIDLWSRHKAIDDPDRARERASQAVCVTRDGNGAICGVGTAIVRVLPRLRQPMYFYRQFFAPEFRGQRQAVAFLNSARQLLQDYNASLEKPESLGVLLELENPMLARHYTRAYEPVADSTFIGYSPKGQQLRVSYFDEARLLPPVQLRRRAMARR